jgi:hypothetical protein
VDGVDRTDVTLASGQPITLSVPADSEIIELIGSDEIGQVVLATYILLDDDSSPGPHALTLEWPKFDDAGLDADDSSRRPDTLLAGLELLANAASVSDWRHRFRAWRDALQWRPVVWVYTPGLAAEARGQSELPQNVVYDVLLSPQQPECVLDIPSEGLVLAGVEDWHHEVSAPLVVLISENNPLEPLVSIAVVDEDTRLLLARFANVAPGRYVVALEPRRHEQP